MIAGRTGRHNEAIPLFRQVIALIPGYGDAHRNLGISLQALGELTQAKACYARALELNAGDADSLNNLGFILHAEGDLEAAISVLRRRWRWRPTIRRSSTIWATPSSARATSRKRRTSTSALSR
jgi:Flp pilus assembly protein TadD